MISFPGGLGSSSPRLLLSTPANGWVSSASASFHGIFHPENKWKTSGNFKINHKKTYGTYDDKPQLQRLYPHRKRACDYHKNPQSVIPTLFHRKNTQLALGWFQCFTALNQSFYHILSFFYHFSCSWKRFQLVFSAILQITYLCTTMSHIFSKNIETGLCQILHV